MNDDLIQLASTYLDGQATAAERAQVDNDAELLAEVERLRRVRAVLASSGAGSDTGTAPISVRERHLAAALDTFDRLPKGELRTDGTPSAGVSADGSAAGDAAGAAGGASITAPISLADQRKKRRAISPRLLTAAAALIVLGGAAFVVQNALVDTDDGNVDIAADGAATAELSEEDLFATGPEAAADETFSDTDDAGEAADVADAPSPAPELAAEAAVGGPEAAPGGSVLELLENDADLALFANDRIIAERRAAEIAADAATSQAEAEPTDGAADAEEAAPAATTPPTLAPPVDLCDLVDEIVGFAAWEDGLFDEPVVVGIDTARGDAIAYRESDCTLIARTPLLPIDD